MITKVNIKRKLNVYTCYVY